MSKRKPTARIVTRLLSAQDHLTRASTDASGDDLSAIMAAFEAVKAAIKTVVEGK
jgi:hypothetical protein